MSDDEKEWEVQTILQRGRFNNITHYLVHWKGYPQEEATWQPIINLENCEDAIMKFQSQFNGKGKDKTSKTKRMNKGQREQNEEEDKRQSNGPHQLIEAFPQNPTTKEKVYFRRPPYEKQSQIQFRQELNITKESNNSQNANLPIGNLNQQRIVDNLLMGKQEAGDKNTISDRLRKKRNKTDYNPQRDRKHDNIPIQNPPRKRIKVNPMDQKDQLIEFSKLKIQNDKRNLPHQIQYTQAFKKRSEFQSDYLSKIEHQNNQIGILKQMFESLIPSEKEKKQEISENKNVTEPSFGETKKTIDKKKTAPEQNQLIPKEILSKTVTVAKDIPSVNPISQSQKEVKALQVTEQPQKLSVNKANLFKNTSRYEQCDQEHLAQKKTTLRNIIRKNLGLELGKHKVRTLDISDQSLLESDLGQVKRLYSETEVDKLELLVKLSYGWVVVGRSKEKELFVVDVNLIKMEYWTVIVSKYLTK